MYAFMGGLQLETFKNGYTFKCTGIQQVKLNRYFLLYCL
jgi:hypothetical protein